MAMYLQLGHDSWNLLEESIGENYAGIVLSPVNDGPAYTNDRLKRLKGARQRYEVILDPQLYNPASQKGKLSEWKFCTSDFETADKSDISWWNNRAIEIVEEASTIGANAICSPAFLDRKYSNEYYRFIVDIADNARRLAAANGIDTLLTVVIPLYDLSNDNRPAEIASILSSSKCDRIYLTFLVDDIPQRQPLRDQSALAAAVYFIRLLSKHMRVQVSFCAHDLVLWKSAGAADISSGKYMNVRRFSPSRWAEEETEGRIISYWNDEKLLTLTRDQEALRLDREGWHSAINLADNPVSAEILAILRSGTGKPWLKLSWLQFLHWCSATEAKIQDLQTGEQILENSYQDWAKVINDVRLLFTDRFNDGTHVTGWLNALREGSKR